MKKSNIVFCLILGSISTLVAATTVTKYDLIVHAELAPFGDVTKKVTTLGAMINNPIVPALLIGSGQQKIAETYGRFRSDAPMYWQVYVQQPAFDIASTNDTPTELAELCETVLIYPSAEKSARMLLSHPGSTREADGTLHLLASESNPDDRWVKFSADGLYCAYATSAGLANLAIDDFAKSAAARRTRAGTERPILRLDVTERGCAAFQKLSQGLSGHLDAMRAVTFALDLDSKGLTAETILTPVSTTVPAVHPLPAGVLDRVAGDAPLFLALANPLQGVASSEAAYRADLVAFGDFVRTNLVVEAKKHEDCKKYGALLDALAAAFSDLLRETPYPAASDWISASLAFDAQRHPCLDEQGEMLKAREADAASSKFLDRVLIALERQWPGKKVAVKQPDGLVIDWAAVIDVAAAEAGLKPNGKEAREIANAKKTVARVLGDTKMELRSSIDGTKIQQHVAAVGVKPVAAKPNGEARVAAALPETARQRPDGVFYLSLYGFVREIVLPTMATFASKKDADQYKAMIAAMPQAEANSALAGAAWTQKDGTRRTLVRLTANEIKNFGAAFNAFTAASMSSALGDDDEDDQ